MAAALEGNVPGGAELQMALLGKALACAGVPVTIVDPLAAGSRRHQENLSIEPVPGWNEGGIRGLRFFSRRLPGLLRTLRSTRAALFYTRGFSFLSLAPLYAARSTGALFVLAAAHDADLMKFPDRHRIFYRRNVSPWGWISTVIPNELSSSLLFAMADVLLVQHEHQNYLARLRGKQAITLRNLVASDEELLRIRSKARRENVILCVGALSARKGLSALFPVVGRLPDLTFEIVGEAQDAEGRRIKDLLARYPNVVLRGALDRPHTLARIARAKALLNTSSIEGFPNTFLEAWSLGTPVVSLFFDPAGTIRRNHLGYVCEGDTELLIDLLRRKSLDLDREQMRQYVLREHSTDKAVGIFQDLLSKGGM